MLIRLARLSDYIIKRCSLVTGQVLPAESGNAC